MDLLKYSELVEKLGCSFLYCLLNVSCKLDQLYCTIVAIFDGWAGNMSVIDVLSVDIRQFW